MPMQPTSTGPIDAVAGNYIHLVLSVGEHDSDYVDAYYGPPEWRQRAKDEKLPLDAIRARAEHATAELENIPVPHEELSRLRHEYLQKQLSALLARVEILGGRKMSFDEESKALYDAVAPHFGAGHFEAIIRQLDALLPGSGDIPPRLERFRADFVIPRDKVDAVFMRAVDAARARTREHVELPAKESFTIEYVTGKSWSGYNWYQGDDRSLIQINIEQPILVDRAIDLACHEGYPGHHVYNVLLEESLVRERGWTEFTVYPLFSPQSLVAEGSGNFGIDVAYPPEERVELEARELFPIAGLDASRAGEYYHVFDILAAVAYAGNEAARGYLDGTMTADQAVDWLIRYALMPPEKATQRIKFFDQYRSYVINYNLGKDLVREYVESRGGTAQNSEARWREFKTLLSSPRLPSGLKTRA
jgi:hypothetical protein